MTCGASTRRRSSTPRTPLPDCTSWSRLAGGEREAARGRGRRGEGVRAAGGGWQMVMRQQLRATRSPQRRAFRSRRSGACARGRGLRPARDLSLHQRDRAVQEPVAAQDGLAAGLCAAGGRKVPADPGDAGRGSDSRRMVRRPRSSTDISRARARATTSSSTSPR